MAAWILGPYPPGVPVWYCRGTHGLVRQPSLLLIPGRWVPASPPGATQALQGTVKESQSPSLSH